MNALDPYGGFTYMISSLEHKPTTKSPVLDLKILYCAQYGKPTFPAYCTGHNGNNKKAHFTWFLCLVILAFRGMTT